MNFTNHSLPYNQTTPLGYFGDVVASIAIGQGYLITSGSIMILFISICLHHRTFFNMFQHFTRKLDQSNRNQSDHECLCHLIRFHLMVKE